jgi:hypothetical protein
MHFGPYLDYSGMSGKASVLAWSIWCQKSSKQMEKPSKPELASLKAQHSWIVRLTIRVLKILQNDSNGCCCLTRTRLTNV